MSGFKDRWNAYDCHDCEGTIVTIDREDGVTPFMVACRATPGCQGKMQSRFYPEGSPPSLPQWEWVRPALTGLKREMREHVKSGGLVLRRIEEVEERRSVERRKP